MNRKWSREPRNLLAEQCVEYFRAYPVFGRLLRGFREKYASYGTFAGTVVLQKLTNEEIEVLEGFFSKSFHGKHSASISAARFEQALKNSRFSGISPREILELYFQEEMTGKRELRQREEEQWQQLFAEAVHAFAGTPAEGWIAGLAAVSGADVADDGNAGLKYMTRTFRESGQDWDEVKRVLQLGARIVNAFPYREDRWEYLAVFAALLTGNPHAFDDGAKDCGLLQLLIAREPGAPGSGDSPEHAIFPAIQKQKSYLRVGILRDDISNYVLLSGIRAWKKDGTIHDGMEGFFREGDMVQLPLHVITGFGRVSCPDNEVYIVENPSIFALLGRNWRGKKACICMNGQPRLGAVLMLDLLADAGTHVYYAGDFDPEGLLIAQKVKQYYGGAFSYWNMTEEVYRMSEPSGHISERRLKMLDRITDGELAVTADAIRRTGLAGYQEKVWELFA